MARIFLGGFLNTLRYMMLAISRLGSIRRIYQRLPWTARGYSTCCAKLLDISVTLVAHLPAVATAGEACYRVMRAVEGKVNSVQVSGRFQDMRMTLEVARTLKQQLPSHVSLFINNHLDIALAVGAGVHLGQRDFPYIEARKLLPKGAPIGVTVNTMEELVEANAWDVSYVGISQLFGSRVTKPTCDPVWGLQGLRRARLLSRHPLLPIGGITKENALEIYRTLNLSTDGVAMVGELWRGQDPYCYAHEMRTIFERARRGEDAAS